MPPEARIAALLSRARRRLFAIECAMAIGAAAALAAIWLVTRMTAGASRVELILTPLALVIPAIVVAAVRSFGRPAESVVEARMPELRNALVTSAQILRGEIHTKPEIRALVLGDTSARTDRIDLAALMPATRPLGVAALGLIALAAAIAFGVTRPERVEGASGRPPAKPGGPMTVKEIEVTITPPAYSQRETVRVENPERLEAFEGSRIDLRVSTSDGSIFTGQLTATNQTYLTVEPDNVTLVPRVLIPLSITPDRPPVIRIGEPGRDLFLANGARDIRVRVAAEDDLGVTALSLAYTKVSGSGETFQFVEGTLPLSVTRAHPREASGSAVINPAALGLATGDMLVYRAIGRDANPARGPVESDAFVIELVSASEAVADGFAIDDQRDKYALSQQMVILKTERLIARRGSLTPAALAEEAAMIAAEQRQVRAEFVFMMGGEVEDEEVEAEHSHELAEGRELNDGRRDLVSAIRAMSDAAALLMKPLMDDALAAEKRALVSLQRALTRSRYILRVLSARERIDDSRRLSGDRTGAPGWRRDAAAPAPSREVETLRAALAALSQLARREAYTDADRAAFSDLARLMLTLPGGPARDAAEALNAAARTREARVAAPLLDRAALAIDAALEAHAKGSSAPGPAVPDRLRGALLDRLRAGGGR